MRKLFALFFPNIRILRISLNKRFMLFSYMPLGIRRMYVSGIVFYCLPNVCFVSFSHRHYLVFIFFSYQQTFCRTACFPML